MPISSKNIQKIKQINLLTPKADSEEYNESDRKTAQKMMGLRSSTTSNEISLKQSEDEAKVQSIPPDPKKFLKKSKKSKIPEIK